MAGHAYKAAVDELDVGVGRELVSPTRSFIIGAELANTPGRTFQDDRSRASRKAKLVLWQYQRSYR